MTPELRKKRITDARQGQPIEELERKARKAIRLRQKLWTQEELDWAWEEGRRWAEQLSETGG